MMNFSYDPILGLQYSFGDLVYLDLECIPEHYTWRDFMVDFCNRGIQIIDSTRGNIFSDDIVRISTNIKISNGFGY